jgi:HEAT repeat protein
MQMPTGAEQCLQKWLGPATIGSPELQAALGSADPHIRYAAALVAGGRKDRTTILKLIACANFDGNFCVQEAAVWALMELSDTQVVPTLCRWLRKDRLMAPLKARVAKALGTIGSARAVEALMAALKHEVGLVQRAAAEALGRIGEPAVEPLIATLQDWDWEVRWAASEALGPIGGPAVAPLIAALQDRNWEVQWAAVEVLGQIGDARAVGPLMAAIQDGDWAVRRAAGRALGRIGEPAVKPLMAALRDRNWAVRWAAAEALGRIGDGRAVKPLMAALRDRNYSVQWAAAEALGQIQQKQERGQR